MSELGKAHAKALICWFSDGKEDQHNIENLTSEITNLLKTSEKRLQRVSATGPFEDSNVELSWLEHPFSKREVLSSTLNESIFMFFASYLLLSTASNSEISEKVLVAAEFLGWQEFSTASTCHRPSEPFSGAPEETINLFEAPQAANGSNGRNFSSITKCTYHFKQGTIIDRIDYNIQNVATTVEVGLKQLHKSTQNMDLNSAVSGHSFSFWNALDIAGREKIKTRKNG
ncbi:hypothetical protein V6N11_000118 [Hibiscus sabdariffa]|uniref:t-SNARE coiled-coil homology domain-containing protein n=1 Tax=Hibiscus sabdariffa TaxID=183260 RepID=A0ABR2NNZ8_9ROSI